MITEKLGEQLGGRKADLKCDLRNAKIGLHKQRLRRLQLDRGNVITKSLAAKE